MLSVILALGLSGCKHDPSEASEENFTLALDKVLNKTEVKIIGPGIALDDKGNFALEDPHAKANLGKQYKVKDVEVFDALISYAKTFEKAGGIKLKEQEFLSPTLFGGHEKNYGYLIEYNEALKKDLQVVPMMGLPIVNAGVLCVDKIVSFTTPTAHNGVTVSEVTFKKGVCKSPQGVDKNVILKSGIMKAIEGNSTYKLKQTSQGWEVFVEEIFKLDYVKYFLEQNIKR